MISIRKYKIVIAAAIAGISGCLIDIITMTALGWDIKGYSELRNTMSAMGASNSPVDRQIAFWWILMGVLIIIYGWGLRYAFKENYKLVRIASWLMILYGVGEGLGSALFPADPSGGHLSWVGMLHDFLGEAGTTGITFFPLVMGKLIPEIKKFSITVVGIGLTGILFFILGHLFNNPNNFFVATKGLWQRIFVYTYYLYVITVSIKLIWASLKVKTQSEPEERRNL